MSRFSTVLRKYSMKSLDFSPHPLGEGPGERACSAGSFGIPSYSPLPIGRGARVRVRSLKLSSTEPLVVRQRKDHKGDAILRPSP